jgi:drug/metabolite transporter (DMT)-like permease
MVVWARYVVHTLLMAGIFLPQSGLRVLRTKKPLWQLARALCLLGTSLFFTTALLYIPLAEATAVNFLAPVLVTALSVPLLKERVTRKLAEVDSPTTSNFFAGLCNTLVMSALVPFFWQVPSLPHAALMLALGSCGMTAHLFLTQAFRHAAPALLAPFGYCQIVFAGLLGWLLFSHTPSGLTVIGIAVICCSGLAAAWQQSRR